MQKHDHGHNRTRCVKAVLAVRKKQQKEKKKKYEFFFSL
jgi:hypothetical protein